LTEHCWVVLVDIEFHMGIGNAVYGQVNSRFDSSNRAMPMVLLRQLQLSYAAIRRDFMDALLRAFLLTRTLTTLRVKMERGDKLGEIRIDPDDLMAHASAQETDLIMGAMVSLLVTAVVHGETTKFLFEWDKSIADDTRYEPLQPSIQCARELLQADLNTARHQVRDRNVGWFVQTVAALRLTFDSDTSPEEMFQAHVFLLNAIRKTAVKRGVADSLATLIEQNWRRLTQYPALLQMPMTTVPAIRAACDSDTNGVSKLATILLAALPAIGMTVPANVVCDIETLRDNNKF
jgi:hypothetical protein